jgi:putative peptide zinc metalloprotease protein
VQERSRVNVGEVQGPSVAPENAATAYASCTDCRTVAVAVQVLMVVGPVSDYEPQNAAVAVNYQCVRCQTFAYANQVLLPVDHRIALSPEARDEIRSLQDQIKATATSGEAFDQMDADLDALTQQLVDVVQHEIDQAGSTTQPDHERNVQQAA